MRKLVHMMLYTGKLHTTRGSTSERVHCHYARKVIAVQNDTIRNGIMTSIMLSLFRNDASPVRPPNACKARTSLAWNNAFRCRSRVILIVFSSVSKRCPHLGATSVGYRKATWPSSEAPFQFTLTRHVHQMYNAHTNTSRSGINIHIVIN